MNRTCYLMRCNFPQCRAWIIVKTGCIKISFARICLVSSNSLSIIISPQLLEDERRMYAPCTPHHIVFQSCTKSSGVKNACKSISNRFLKSHIIIILLDDAYAAIMRCFAFVCIQDAICAYIQFSVWHSRNSGTIAPSNYICKALIQNSVISTYAFSSVFISFTWNDQIKCIASCCTKCVKLLCIAYANANA